MKIFWVFLLFALMFMGMWSCSKDKSTDLIIPFSLNTPDQLPSMSYTVYSTVLKSLFPNTTTLIVEQETSAKSSLIYGTLFYDTIASYIPESKDSMMIINFNSSKDSILNLDKKIAINNVYIKLISESELINIFDATQTTNGWPTFYERYPTANGLISLSNISYASDSSLALMEVGYMTDLMMGTGTIFLLSNTLGQWKITKELKTWSAK